MPRLDDWLAFALACCDAADVIALEHFRRDLVIETKPDRTFVTQADTAIERMIRERIGRASPTTASSARSTARRRATGPIRWYIDPIDGTHNFMRGVPLFGTLLAVEGDGELVAASSARRPSASAGTPGVAAARGRSARSAGRRDAAARSASRASPPSRTRRSCTRRRSRSRRAGEAPGFDGLIRRSGASAGSAILGLRAGRRGRRRGDDRGRAEELGPGRAVVVVEEAGGRMTDLHGVRTIHGGTALATNGILHDEVVRDLAG